MEVQNVSPLFAYLSSTYSETFNAKMPRAHFAQSGFLEKLQPSEDFFQRAPNYLVTARLSHASYQTSAGEAE